MKTVLYCGFQSPVGLCRYSTGRRGALGVVAAVVSVAAQPTRREADGCLQCRTSVGGVGDPQVDFTWAQEIVEYKDGAPEDSRLRSVADGHDV